MYTMGTQLWDLTHGTCLFKVQLGPSWRGPTLIPFSLWLSVHVVPGGMMQADGTESPCASVKPPPHPRLISWTPFISPSPALSKCFSVLSIQSQLRTGEIRAGVSWNLTCATPPTVTFMNRTRERERKQKQVCPILRISLCACSHFSETEKTHLCSLSKETERKEGGLNWLVN